MIGPNCLRPECGRKRRPQWAFCDECARALLDSRVPQFERETETVRFERFAERARLS